MCYGHSNMILSKGSWRHLQMGLCFKAEHDRPSTSGSINEEKKTLNCF